MTWRLLIPLVLAVLPLELFWLSAMRTIHQRTEEDEVESALGVRVAGHIQEIVNLNRELQILRAACAATSWWPPSVAAYQTQAAIFVAGQVAQEALIRMALYATYPGKNPYILFIPTLRKPPGACSLPGDVYWGRDILYSHQIEFAGVKWKLSHGSPVWLYANDRVRALQ